MQMKTIFLVLLLCMFVATPMAAKYGDNSGPWQCYPGYTFPQYPLPGCRAVVKLQCVGRQVPETVQRDCCQQLAKISDWCRCPAVVTMLGSMFKELSVEKGQDAREVFPGCRREVMKLTAASVPAVCKLPIVIDASGQGAYVCSQAMYLNA